MKELETYTSPEVVKVRRCSHAVSRRGLSDCVWLTLSGSFHVLVTGGASSPTFQIVVGNKVDKEFSRQVTTSEGRAFAERTGCL